MKYPRSRIQSKVHALFELHPEGQTLTSFTGLVIFRRFFASIDLKSRPRRCFEPAELKSRCHLDYVRTLYGNQTGLPAGLFA